MGRDNDRFVKIYGVPGRCRVIETKIEDGVTMYRVHPPAHAFMAGLRDHWWTDDDIEPEEQKTKSPDP